MSDWPKTRDELIARFCEPNHNGHVAVPERELFTRFVDEALSRPDALHAYAFKDLKGEQPCITPDVLCGRIYDHGYFLSVDTGWVDTDGNFWPCGYASHERMLEYMGMNSIDQELVGWIKLSRRNAMGRFFPNDKQMAAIVKIMDAIDEHNKSDAAGAMPGSNIDLSPLMDLPKQRRQK